jgi:hypothetical protein
MDLTIIDVKLRWKSQDAQYASQYRTQTQFAQVPEINIIGITRIFAMNSAKRLGLLAKSLQHRERRS